MKSGSHLTSCLHLPAKATDGKIEVVWGIVTELLGWMQSAWHISHLSLSLWPGLQSHHAHLKTEGGPSAHPAKNSFLLPTLSAHEPWPLRLEDITSTQCWGKQLPLHFRPRLASPCGGLRDRFWPWASLSHPSLFPLTFWWDEARFHHEKAASAPMHERHWEY